MTATARLENRTCLTCGVRKKREEFYSGKQSCKICKENSLAREIEIEMGTSLELRMMANHLWKTS